MIKRFTKLIRGCYECPNCIDISNNDYDGYDCEVTHKILSYTSSKPAGISESCPLYELTKEEEFLEEV